MTTGARDCCFGVHAATKFYRIEEAVHEEAKPATADTIKTLKLSI